MKFARDNHSIQIICTVAIVFAERPITRMPSMCQMLPMNKIIFKCPENPDQSHNEAWNFNITFKFSGASTLYWFIQNRDMFFKASITCSRLV